MEIANWNNVAVLTSTVDSAIDAERLAQTAVQVRVAACVQIEAIHSHYEWQGSLERSAEWRLVFKTLPEAVDGLLDWLKAEHPYEVPQLLLRMEAAHPDYAGWVAAQVDIKKVSCQR